MLPFLTAYDPPGTSEGTLDPLGLYQIADQLATRLVPAVRERMQRVRFLTAITVGAQVTDGIDSDPSRPEAAPFLVWEWLVVEAFVRAMADDPDIWGVPGTLVTRRALSQYNYLDYRSYLKTPRIFGFHGVYKRLATQTGLVDVHLAARIDGEKLVDDWSRDAGVGGTEARRPLLHKWQEALKRSLAQSPPRTKPSWSEEHWLELAQAFSPRRAKAREKRNLKALLLSTQERSLGALSYIWNLQETFEDDAYSEERLHDKLEVIAPEYAVPLRAIRSYETFCRCLQDAFDVMLAEAQTVDARGFAVTAIGHDPGFVAAVQSLSVRYEQARAGLADVDTSLQHLFDERFAAFGRPMTAPDIGLALCDHHEAVQGSKSADGKRPWFDRVGPESIYVRQRYRQSRQPAAPGKYVHDYRGRPIRRFYFDLK
jgi:hypothetical protein